MSVEDLKDSGAEGRSDLVLDDLDAGIVPDDFIPVLELSDTADVEADRGIELQGIPPSGRLRRAVGVAPDLLTKLIDEDAGERMTCSAMSSACSPLSGCEM